MLIEEELDAVDCLPIISLPSKYVFDVALVRIERAEIASREGVAEVADEGFCVGLAGLENAKNVDDCGMQLG